VKRLSIETRLLTLLARATVPAADAERASSLIAGGISWPLLGAQARFHGVTPLLFRSLERLRSHDVPGDVLAELCAVYRENAVRNAILAHELRRVLVALVDAGVPVMPLKGVALAESLYGDAALRVCSDIDILVPRARVRHAHDTIVGLGYRTEFTEKFFLDLLTHHDIECAFSFEGHGVEYTLDLHWGVSWPGVRGRRAMDELWAEARPSSFRGVAIHGLGPEWEVLVLAIHAARHRWQALKWLVDVHELCVRGGIDWSIVRERAGELGWHEIVQITLGLSHLLLETPMPAELRAGNLPSWLETFELGGEPSGAWRNALFPMRLLPGRIDRLAHLARVLLVPTLAERRVARLPSSLAPFYYVLRPLRLGGRSAWSAIRWGADAVKARCA
jgi:hypothetical protein